MAAKFFASIVMHKAFPKSPVCYSLEKSPGELREGKNEDGKPIE